MTTEELKDFNTLTETLFILKEDNINKEIEVHKLELELERLKASKAALELAISSLKERIDTLYPK